MADPLRPATMAVVGIGASAGGLDALMELLGHLPPDTGMAFVIVTHQHAGHASLLPELLGKSTTMPVKEVTDGALLVANHLYLSRPGRNLALRDSHLHVAGESSRDPLPIDYFLQSLAADQKRLALCVILSGTGTDGSLGLKAVKSAGGVAIVQQPETAKYAGMPQSAIATGQADFVLPLSAIPRQLLVSAARHAKPAIATDKDRLDADLAEPLEKIFVLLQQRTGHDFSAYKVNTVRRRIESQMQAHQLQRPSDYLRLLQESPAEIDALFRSLLINVTRFFRDPEAFGSLLQDWLTPYLARVSENRALRIWVPGCASGEEVYSLAIVLLEYMEQTQRRFDVQIFGTDLDADAVEQARRGRYPDSISADVSPARLERYFTRDDGSYRINKEVRRLGVFAQQSLIRDPPFTRLDLISCRNVLIYMTPELQQKLIAAFAYSLKPGGLLMLGTSETLGQADGMFEAVDKKWKLYHRKVGPSAALPAIGRAAPIHGFGHPPPTSTSKEPRILGQIERLLLTRYCPTSIVFNERGDIIHLQGRTGALLEPAEGRPRMNVLEMARDGLKRPLAHAVRQVIAEDKDIQSDNLEIKMQGTTLHVDLTVARIRDPEPIRGLLIATFRAGTKAQTSAGERRKVGRSTASPDYVESLERELERTTESLQNTIEELETANEELISANEEAQSTNEEMQSSNEELETSQEELQSLNEELNAVNAELRLKIDQLGQTSDDMQNLLDSTDIATVFLDRSLRIKRYTESARDLINLIPGDIGRPIADLTSKLRYPELTLDCHAVLRSLSGKQTEVETTDGASYLARILPYRTMDHTIEGLVLTFDNIEELKKAQRLSAQSLAYFESVVNSVREMLLVLDHELRVVRANPRFYRMFGLDPAGVEGQLIYTIAEGTWDIPSLRELLEKILPDQPGFDDYPITHEFPRLGCVHIVLNARRLEREPGLPPMILLAMEDVTHRTLTQEMSR